MIPTEILNSVKPQKQAKGARAGEQDASAEGFLQIRGCGVQRMLRGTVSTRGSLYSAPAMSAATPAWLK